MPAPTTPSSSPPKARLVFRVGIVGHRPNRLRPEDVRSLTDRLGTELASVKKIVEAFPATHPGLYSDAPPLLRAVSPLAEGTDRYFARQAVKLGYELCCPFPFHKEEFEGDFKPGKTLEPDMDSIADFNSILTEAGKNTGLITFELDGSPSDSSEAYAAAGSVVLNQSDLLIVVWDGGGGNKHGGTFETLNDALSCGVPVLWMDSQAPHPCQLLRTETDLPPITGERCVPRQADLPDLEGVVQAMLAPPTPASDGRAHLTDLREAYFQERQPGFNLWFVWKFFRDLVGKNRFSVPDFHVRPFEETVSADWSADAPGTAGWVNSRLSRHYAWADGLANFYADKYRGAFISSYLLGALAVALALVPHSFIWSALSSEEIASSPVESICSLLEFIAVLVIIVLVLGGNRRHWHDRWLSYRLLAELIRQLRFVVPLGGGKPFRRPISPFKPANPANSWMYWHLRSIDREVGLPAAKVTTSYVQESLQYVNAIVQGQIAFHEATKKTAGRIERRLHAAGVGLFFATFVLIAAHFLSHPMRASAKWRHTMELCGVTFFCAALPAVGAALAGINHQGEFVRTERRSAAMVEALVEIRGQLDRLLQPGAIVRSPEAAAHALRAAQIMVDEVLDWRVVFLDRPLDAS
jgi:hypothetical protein